MSNNLLNIAMSGINSAQTAMAVIGNNISKSRVDGYNRQNVIMSENNGVMTSGGYIGTGVNVSQKQRNYDSLLDKQFNKALSDVGLSEVYSTQAQKISKLFAESDSDINSQINNFFKSISALSGNAADQTSRLQVLNDAGTLVNQFKFLDNQLTLEKNSSNERMFNYAEEVSSLAEQVAKLNNDIFKAKSTNGIEPFDMLDQRESLVRKISAIVEVKIDERDGFTNLSLSNGMNLVYQEKSNALVVQPSKSDPSKSVVGFKDNRDVVRELGPQALGSGKLEGELKYRREVIDIAHDQLNQTALIFTERMNQIHKNGFDLNNAPGIDFFTYGSPEIMANSGNTQSDHFDVKFDSANITNIQASDYSITRKGNSWEIKRLSDNSTISPQILANGDLRFDGLIVTPPNTPNSAEGDNYRLMTVRNVIDDLKLNIDSADKIAAKSSITNGKNDGSNLTDIVKLQTEKSVNGLKSIAESLIAMGTEVGQKAHKSESQYENKLAIAKSINQNQQSISGVNVDEEYINLTGMTQYYQANAKVLSTATELFDILMRNL
nr:flagellar hook-associated protein FlgK [uncultured Moellerella sp.]